MNIDDLEELAEHIARKVPGIEGPAFTDHGYVASRTMTFWSGDRRVHFYFLNDRGAISVLCEVAELRPKRRVVTGKASTEDEAVKVVDRFLKKKKGVDDLPDLHWQKESAHDELVPHPPSSQPGVSVGLVGKMPEKETKRTDIVTKILSRPASVVGIGGVTIYSKQPERLAAWYREKLGLVVRQEGESHVAALGEVTLTIIEAAGKLPDGLRMIFNLRVNHFDAYVEQLALRGVDIEALDRTSAGKFAYVRDPDGNPIELWAPA